MHLPHQKSLTQIARRYGCLIVFGLVLSTTSSAEARLFWQNYGSTIPTADGCGCTWNWNQDYFVPRHTSSCRYDLFGCGKTACTTSPACRRCHPVHAGYCTIYGPWHYCRKDRVYKCRCGCTPLKLQHTLGPGGVCRPPCEAGCCPGGVCHAPGFGSHESCCEAEILHTADVRPIPNAEPFGLEVLGSIPVEGNELFSGGDLSLLEKGLTDQKQAVDTKSLLPEELLPLLGIPQQGKTTQP